MKTLFTLVLILVACAWVNAADKVIQVDPFGDGWYGLVRSDDGTHRLIHVYDVRGRKAPKPTDATFIAMATKAKAAEAALAALPVETLESVKAELEAVKAELKALKAEVEPK